MHKDTVILHQLVSTYMAMRDAENELRTKPGRRTQHRYEAAEDAYCVAAATARDEASPTVLLVFERHIKLWL